VIAGATAAGLTVRVALPEVTELTLLLTTTE